MRQMFAAHLPPGEEFFQKLWSDAIVVVDTNVLLNLYRFSEGTRDEIFEVLDALKDRLWMPHQVGWEFFRRRANAMTDNQRDALRALNSAKKALDQSASGLRGRLASTHHLDEVTRKIDETIESVEAARRSRVEQYGEDDPVLAHILDLYDSRVAAEPEAVWLANEYKRGRERYSNAVPPGFRDATSKKDEDPRSLYGDYLLWAETLRHAKSKELPVILVSNDQKEDWVEVVSGKKFGPRKEMLAEFASVTKQVCWVYRVQPFLEHARAFIQAQVSDEAMEEVDEYAERPTARRRRSQIDIIREMSQHTDMASIMSPAVLAAMSSELDAIKAIQSPAWLSIANQIAEQHHRIAETMPFVGISSALAELNLDDITRSIAPSLAIMESVDSGVLDSITRSMAAFEEMPDYQELVGNLIPSLAFAKGMQVGRALPGHAASNLPDDFDEE